VVSAAWRAPGVTHNPTHVAPATTGPEGPDFPAAPIPANGQLREYSAPGTIWIPRPARRFALLTTFQVPALVPAGSKA
jgi:hypothetical protein